ncbi:MAG: hypothetical protein M3Z33_03595 [Actinomycetota bacterium]|nr:hypothetical protein [Actinomycetota bacterium]
MGLPVGEVTPGILHWTAHHPRIGIDVSSYCLTELRVLIDPITPAEGVGWFGEQDLEPAEIWLTNRHHYRSSAEFVAAYGCAVRCHQAGLHEFTHGEPVTPFRFGDELVGGTVAHEVDAICPEETALHLPRVFGLALADGLIREGDGPVGFVPDHLIGDEPDPVKVGLTAAFGRLLELDFEHLLLAHGEPVIGDGRAVLEEFVRAQRIES